MDDLRAAIEALNASPGLPLRLVVLDTWDSARTHSDGGWAGQDGLVEGIMSGLRQMAEDYSIGVVVVHHTTRGDDSRARGSAVFDAKCDWMASVTGDGHTIALDSTKVRDGEEGRVGTWSITGVVVGEAVVPVLTPCDGEAKPVEAAADQRMPSMVAYLASHPGKHTARSLQERLGWKSLSYVTAAAQSARAAGHMEPSSYTLTAAGIAFADSVLTVQNNDLCSDPLEQSVLPTHGRTEQTVNTVRSDRTDIRTPNVCSTPPPVCNTGESEQGPNKGEEEVRQPMRRRVEL